MAIATSTLDIPKNPAERRAWILYRLKCKGSNFRALARELGCSHQAISIAAGGMPSRHIELALAARIGVRQQELFPEHYDKNGRRLPLARSTERIGKGSRPAAQHNVEKTEAA
ncbi:hypothetical protein D3874_03240 [Oleomonas cavernae]|uniref:Ner winged helix-turn-helix DNA-binding domain-containing protein n=2 Tax=Oleomonas cavernae TaxID=2320859 RepID=A0A418WU96_9PROT|nr:hypothetical protein D3874_03240 [Oleomonas cavernae]